MTEFQQALFDHLVRTLHSTPAEERRNSKWVMSGEWLIDIRSLVDGRGYPIWELPRPVEEPDYLFGLPFEIKDGSGPPHLEAKE